MATRIVTVSIDEERCQGHARCWSLCPEVFGVDEAGYGQVRDDADLGVHADAIERAAANCPEQAIALVRSDG